MRSDFSSARQSLERAFDLLQGSDRLSERGAGSDRPFDRGDGVEGIFPRREHCENPAFPQTTFLRPLISMDAILPRSRMQA